MKLELRATNFEWNFISWDVEIGTEKDIETFRKCIEEALRKYKMYKE